MSVDSLLALYQSWLLTACEEGVISPCTDARLIEQVRQSILEEPDLHNTLHNDAFSLIASGLLDKQDLLPALQRMADAFQSLEQAALNLYVTPWRKEIHTIKTYSGHYVHLLESALPEDGLFSALRKLGYEPQAGGNCLSLKVQPTPHTLQMAALGFLAAQLECCILMDIVSCSGPELVNGADLIRERQTWRGEAACMERLRKLIQEGAAPVPKSPPQLDLYKDDGEDCDAALYRSPFCGHCQESWDQHVNGSCRDQIDNVVHLRRSETLLKSVGAKGHTSQLPRDLTMHDCVFSDKTLERHCEDCHLIHSASCSLLRRCKGLGHRLAQLSPSEKREAVMEEQGNRYQLHVCLQPGQLPHYRCAQCKELHYIKCKGLSECRRQGHSANMIMLEKDQRLWLQRSLMNLTELCVDGSAV
ncbi:spermatogenesis-associated protein 2-like protein [Hyperolius riggenbachi]|uniref:spermatogenesis-associated protein 2-like protein n=1 Tax=Hyperolius riggenbachi TaxID=752182 RepID=UPI0035A3080E